MAQRPSAKSCLMTSQILHSHSFICLQKRKNAGVEPAVFSCFAVQDHNRGEDQRHAEPRHEGQWLRKNEDAEQCGNHRLNGRENSRFAGFDAAQAERIGEKRDNGRHQRGQHAQEQKSGQRWSRSDLCGDIRRTADDERTERREQKGPGCDCAGRVPPQSNCAENAVQSIADA